MNLTEKSQFYKPFKYDWAYEMYLKQSQCHWTANEINYSADIKDWNSTLTEGEKSFLTQILRFFTQADVDVAAGYCDYFIPYFKNNEIRMALLTNAQMEVTHQDSYSKIIDTLNLPSLNYSVFMEYKEMKDKNDYFEKFSMSSPLEVAKTTALYGAFSEGLQLFASFAMLLNFQRFNKMKSMCQVVAYSMRDESLHVETMIKIYHTYITELLQNHEISSQEIKEINHSISNTAKDIVRMEDAFIDLAFTNFEIEGITAQEMKDYIRYIANIRLQQLNIPMIYHNNKANPLRWLEQIQTGLEFSNFFEAHPTNYTKASTVGTWSEAY